MLFRSDVKKAALGTAALGTVAGIGGGDKDLVLGYGLVRGLEPPARFQVKGRLPGRGLGTKKTWDSPGSPLLPGLPRRPGGPRQENKDGLFKMGSQGFGDSLPAASCLQLTRIAAAGGIACPPPCWLGEWRGV